MNNLEEVYEDLDLSFNNTCVVIEALCNAYMDIGDIEYAVYAKGLLEAHINIELTIAEEGEKNNGKI